MIEHSNLRQLEIRYHQRLRAKVRSEHDYPVTQNSSLLSERTVVREVIGFYSLVELGCLASVLPRPLPEDFQSHAKHEVSELFSASTVRSNAPELRLPRLLQIRLLGRWGQLDYERTYRATSIYSQLLMLNAMVEDDERVVAFLAALTGESEPKLKWSDITDALQKRDVIVERFSRPDSEQDVLAQCLGGFARYLECLPEIERLLQFSRKYPLLQSGIWHYHSFVLGNREAMERLFQWFTILDNTLQGAGFEMKLYFPSGQPDWSAAFQRVMDSIRRVSYDSPITDALDEVRDTG